MRSHYFPYQSPKRQVPRGEFPWPTRAEGGYLSPAPGHEIESLGRGPFRAPAQNQRVGRVQGRVTNCKIQYKKEL